MAPASKERVEIPGGRFTMGLSREQAERLRRAHRATPFPFHTETPERPVTVRPFALDVTPVTNERFAAFVEAGGYADERYWEELLAEPALAGREVRARFVDSTGKPGPLSWAEGKPPPGKARHPVSGVSWYEAKAYCRFRGVRLPTEAEWELAARGKEGWLYPWGNEFDPSRCAHRGRTERDTVSVDSLPEGKSPYGILHLAGNVAEWVEDRYLPYPGSMAGKPPSLSRVVRNDFYLGTPETLRATVRTPRNPTDRFRGFGFRCASELRFKPLERVQLRHAG